MLPNPLHPAVVHFPIVLASLAPLFALGALWAIRRGSRPVLAWGLVAAMLAGLFVSSLAAVRTGEAQEDRVEDILSERGAMHTHEEAAERFLVLTGGVLAIGLVGLAGGRIGSSARLVAMLGTLVVLGAGVSVGRSGGELVYRHGAAAAYARTPDGARGPGEDATEALEPAHQDSEH